MWRKQTTGEAAADDGTAGRADGAELSPEGGYPNSEGRTLIPGHSETRLTMVAVYDLGFDEPRRVAEFRLTSAGSVALTTPGPDECPLAEDWYADGVERYESGEPGPTLVPPDDGAEFLQALLDLPPMSYYRLVAEGSSSQPDASGRAQR